jgi:hypothetical protein
MRSMIWSAVRVQVTRRQADRLSVYDVVGRWLHREPAFLHEHEPEHHLEELALMTVSAEWLTCWQPISMHRALLAGATPDQVAEAAGMSVRGVHEQCKQWADGQRHSLIAGRPGVTQEVCETIQARLRQPTKYCRSSRRHTTSRPSSAGSSRTRV